MECDLPCQCNAASRLKHMPRYQAMTGMGQIEPSAGARGGGSFAPIPAIR